MSSYRVNSLSQLNFREQQGIETVYIVLELVVFNPHIRISPGASERLTFKSNDARID